MSRLSGVWVPMLFAGCAFGCRGEPGGSETTLGTVGEEVPNTVLSEPPATTSGGALEEVRVRQEHAAEDADGDRAPPVVVTPLPELCREACANTLRIVGGELPQEAAASVREELERALTAECPGRCLQRASVESARCIAAAKTALELAACR